MTLVPGAVVLDTINNVILVISMVMFHMIFRGSVAVVV